MICNPCKICIHTYTCSCIDNSIHCVICKHIHTVVNFTACSTPALELNTEIEIEAGPSEVNTKFDTHINQHQTLVEIKLNESKLVHKIQYMLALIKTTDFDMNSIKHLNKVVDQQISYIKDKGGDKKTILHE
jgi:hypothetical protein